MSELLGADDTATQLAGTAFVHGDGVLQAAYTTGDFSSAVRLLDQVAHAADAMNHHPDVTVGYGSIGFTLSSHDAGGVTARDVELARRIQDLADVAGATKK
ncbi:4a-hydroxytetrahydrobiopterin dehydratase [Cryobacterium tepidiphilum]|uniref:Putative pterin-4-alpha-carbinolamine dehydratase n=1 Tax=Cryobacterium tepidiphilum TaxID=2486026 RepID=A0A3M8LGY6_9MICO|nr:4a-hydroxytetrahydrobiopterin dehydratase [Cryobacterium tepidiphilum]RNE63934.1 4a-hydroxytetrahydrobiopterin dehydratase [Cryobacterium tepidiphilum]